MSQPAGQPQGHGAEDLQVKSANLRIYHALRAAVLPPGSVTVGKNFRWPSTGAGRKTLKKPPAGVFRMIQATASQGGDREVSISYTSAGPGE
ncbi:hypothetical protein AC578_7785 [Pseudocercospora eumusae]|uniref:Uncharacterized protein n=1 Tax=Pseudocercospora eumusae TaxID=321146 RepID=A0A139H0X6_9PEZI|nr:hypothetical protein AC578_7785 [Pseudocercospora eumusae]